jgi:hypothetical protein
LTKRDDLLIELDRAFDAYVKSFFPFEYQNKTYRLVNIYVASPWTRCDLCGNHPIKKVSVIRSNDCQQLRVGNDYIDRITNRRLSEWFNDYIRKLQNIISNRKYIDGLSSMLKAYERNELPFQMPNGDVVKLLETFELLCNGLNPERKQEQLAECYLSRKTNV